MSLFHKSSAACTRMLAFALVLLSVPVTVQADSSWETELVPHAPGGITYLELADLILTAMPYEQQYQKVEVVITHKDGPPDLYEVLGVTVAGSQPYLVTKRIK